MLAVNEPTVVLASVQTKFLGPVVVGDRIEAESGRGPYRRPEAVGEGCRAAPCGAQVGRRWGGALLRRIPGY